MKTIVLHGSPRKEMNSDTLVEEFLRGLNETDNHEATHFYVNEMEIRPCQGCLYCATSEGHSCRIEDDMQRIYSAYRDADLIVWASPMYWGYLTAQLKTVQDRMEALAWSGFEDKTFAVIITYRHHYQSALGMFQRIAPHFNIKLHSVVCQTYDPEKRVDLPIADCKKELEACNQLGRELGKHI
jgi:multimeric flavodoxin WrbA